jgi:hypothetical protein
MDKADQVSLFGLAGASQSMRQSAHKGVVVREVRCKSLLNRYSIDDYSFNCYIGCAHGCRYCYARFAQRSHPPASESGHAGRIPDEHEVHAMNVVMNALIVAILFGIAESIAGPLAILIKPRREWTLKDFAMSARFCALAAAAAGAMLSIASEAGGDH